MIAKNYLQRGHPESVFLQNEGPLATDVFSLAEEYGKCYAEQARKGEYEWNIERKKIKKVCSLCGSEEVLVDAYAQWDVEKQKFVLNSTFEHSFCFCNACERECQIIDEEMKYGE